MCGRAIGLDKKQYRRGFVCSANDNGLLQAQQDVQTVVPAGMKRCGPEASSGQRLEQNFEPVSGGGMAFRITPTVPFVQVNGHFQTLKIFGREPDRPKSCKMSPGDRRHPAYPLACCDFRSEKRFVQGQCSVSPEIAPCRRVIYLDEL